mgnify:CR=1 FL=1
MPSHPAQAPPSSEPPWGWPSPPGPGLPPGSPSGSFPGPDPWGPPPETAVDARRWGIGDVLWGLLIVIGLSVVFSIPIAVAQLAGVELGMVWITVVSVVAMWAGFFGWPLYCAKRKGLGSLKADFGFTMEWYDLLIGIAAGIGSLVLIAIIGIIEINVAEQAPESNTQVISEATGTPIALVIVVLGAPVFEELFFRGLTYGAVDKRFNRWAALAVSTVLFTVLHAQPAATALGFGLFLARIGAIGLVLGVLRMTTGRLGAPIVAHMTVNGVATIAVLAGGA